jgi:hypothetical protein
VMAGLSDSNSNNKSRSMLYEMAQAWNFLYLKAKVHNPISSFCFAHATLSPHEKDRNSSCEWESRQGSYVSSCG